MFENLNNWPVIMKIVNSRSCNIARFSASSQNSFTSKTTRQLPFLFEQILQIIIVTEFVAHKLNE